MAPDASGPSCPQCRTPLRGAGSCPRCLAAILATELASETDGAAPVKAAAPPALAMLGPYQLLEEIARGGMGVVYRAQQPGLNRDVAVKVILAGPFAGPTAIARFRTEAKAAARLRHPHIVTVHEFGEAGGHHWLSMDYVAGQTLAALTREGPLPARLAARHVRAVADAVAHAHRHGVIHRDLKPGNVIIDGDDEPRVTDFGLAKQLDQHDSPTLTGQALGTPGFAAPEQLSPKLGTVDARSDVYGLGALLYHLLTGRPPFLAGSLAETIEQTAHAEPAPPRALNPAVPRDLETICLKCLAKEPARRYATAHEVAQELARWLAGEPIAARPTPSWERVARWARRRPALAALATAVLVLSMAVAVVSTVSAVWLSQAKQESERQRKTVEAISEKQSLQLAEASFARGDNAGGLARLAQVLRRDPNNAIAAQRLMSALTHRLYLLPLTEPLAHTDIVHRLRFSPDGQRLATASADGTAKIWDVASGRLLHTLGHGGAVWWLEFDPGGGFLGTACADLTARIWNVTTGEPVTPPLQTVKPETLPDVGFGRIAPFADIRGLTCFSFSPNGRSFAVAGRHRVAEVWDFDGREARLRLTLPHSKHVHSARFSFDGRRLATACFDRRARIWDVATGELLADLPHVDRVFWAEFSPDGTRFVTAERGGFARVWEADTGRPVHVLKHLMEVTFAHFSPDGRRIVTVSEDTNVRVWDTATGKLDFLSKHPARVIEARFSPNGRLVATAAEDRYVRLFDLTTGEPFAEPARHDAGVLDVVFSADGSRLATASLDHTARIWAIPQVPAVPRFEHGKFVDTAELTRDGKRLLTASGDGTAALWDVLSGNRLQTFRHHGRVMSAVFSPDESLVLTASADRTARLWRTQGGEPVGEPIRHSEPVESAQFSPDGQWVVTASNDGNSRLTNVKTGEARPLVGVDKDVRWASFSPDGRRIVTAAEENVAQIWNAATGQPVGEPLPHPYWVIHAEFSPDSQRVATACKDGAVRVWNAVTGQLLVGPLRQQSGLYLVRYSPDGRLLATASRDGTARLWHAATGQPAAEPLRHGFEVEGIAFDPDGARVATASNDRTARVWDVATGHPLSEPFPQGSAVHRAGFSADGRRLVTAGSGEGQAALIWDIPLPPLPVPDWLPDVVETLASERLNEAGLSEPVSLPAASVLAARAETGQGAEFYRRWARWFFTSSAVGAREPFTDRH